MKRIALLIPLVILLWDNPGPSPPLARLWIAVFQERFGHVTPEDIREGLLGVDRVAMTEPTPLARRFNAKSSTEVQALEGLADGLRRWLS